MSQALIFYPVAALAALTFAVLLMMPYRRAMAIRQKAVVVEDFKLGESDNVPDEVCLPNRNYMNLLELPVLFYVVCLSLFITQGVSDVAVFCAWGFVAARTVHSAIHLSYNHVWHRMSAFVVSNGFLLALWGLFMVHLAAI